MSVFAGANNVVINGGNFTAALTTIVNAGHQNDIVGILYSHSATVGLLDAKERFEAPKCDKGTRTSMILGMKKFVQDGNAASSPGLYWLYGSAGVGKSALAQSLSLSLKDEGDHAASFFFSRTSPGRNNGDQLVVTLAYQLAKNIPALQPLISKVVRTNPDILTASNTAQMKGLIVDPINEWHKKYNWSIRGWMGRLSNAKPHPRLVLIDGLDECNNPNVQTDLILCIASAVRQLSIPLRFVVTSRPESHIVATFELNSAFRGPDGVTVTKKNLRDDGDANEQITKFLLKEFAEIRRTHPLRNFLPQHWPYPDQIGQLVSKSSESFIYMATVTRCIKMPHNRPDECLNRILALSVTDQPFEPLDSLYRHILKSVPKANKHSIRGIFHFLVASSNWDGVTDPETIERHFHYPHGHVQHVLSDLLCLVEFNPSGRIQILHASLPDFLLDVSRSGSLCIDAADAHAAIAASYLLSIHSTNELPSHDSGFPEFLNHLMQANMLDCRLSLRILQMNLLPRCMHMCNPNLITGYKIDLSDSSIMTKVMGSAALRLVSQSHHGITYLMAYLLAIVMRHGPEDYIRHQIAAIKTYAIEAYPAAGDVHVVNEQIIPFMTLWFRQVQKSVFFRKQVTSIFGCKVAPNGLHEAIFEIYSLMMASLHQHVINMWYSETKGSYPMEHLEQGIRQGPNFWANVVHGIDNSSDITPTKSI